MKHRVLRQDLSDVDCHKVSYIRSDETISLCNYVCICIYMYMHVYNICIYVCIYIYRARAGVLPGEVRFDCAGLVFYEIRDFFHLPRWMSIFVSKTQNPKTKNLNLT